MILTDFFSVMAAVREDVYGKELPELREISGPIIATEVFGNNLYTVGNDLLRVYNIDQPDQPKEIGRLADLGYTRQIAIQRNIAYIASRQFGLYVVDVSNPAKPRKLSHYDTIDMATGIAVSGPIAAVACRNHGVELLDVSNPEKIRHFSVIRSGESQSVIIRNGYLYVGAWHNRELVICDIRNPYEPKIVGRSLLDGYGDGLDLQGDYCYMATGHHAAGPDGRGKGHGLEIINISNPANPKRVGLIKFPAFYSLYVDMWSVKVNGKYAVVNDTHNGLFVVDVANPAKPQCVAYRTFGQAKGKQELNPLSGLALGHGVIYCAGLWTGLHVVGASQMASIIPERNDIVMPLPEPPAQKILPDFNISKFAGPVMAVAADTPWIYLALGTAGIQTARLSADNTIVPQKNYATNGIVVDVKIKGDLLLSAEDSNGLRIWQRHSDGTLTELSSYRKPRELIRQIAVFPNSSYALLQVNSSVLVILDISTPSKPIEVLREARTGFNYGHQLPGELLNGRYAGCFWHVNGIHWYDMQCQPVKAVKYHAMGWQDGEAVIGDKLVVMQKNDYCLLDLDSPKDVSRLPRYSSVKTPLFGRRMLYVDKMLYLTNNASGHVQKVNVADLQHPVVVKEWQLDGNPGLPILINGKMLIPSAHQGLLFEK